MTEQKINSPIAIQVADVKKMYKLGQIGGGTLQADLQSWWARVRGKEDPNTKIGADQRSNGTTFMALNGIDLTIFQGEAVGIIGSNGAGKSTLLKLLSKVTAPSEGTIDIYGRIASMLEVGTGFNGEMTGRENVYLNGAILGMTKEEIDSKMEDIIEFSEVREFIDTPVKRYSSGMYVKLAFSVAAHLDSEIMIMDEVLAVGDMAFQKKCLTKMREAAKQEGRTVLYVSHNMNTIRQLCDRCIVLDKGKVIFEGEVEKAIDIYLGTAGKLERQYVYTQKHHSHKRSNESFVIQSLFFCDVEEPVYQSGEEIAFILQYSSKVSKKELRFRFEISSSNGIKVGTVLTNKSIAVEPTDSDKIKISLNSSHLVHGRYAVDIVAYEFDEFGNEEFVDGVYPGFCFEIREEVNEDNSLVWLPQYWGYVHLDDAIIVLDNK